MVHAAEEADGSVFAEATVAEHRPTNFANKYVGKVTLLYEKTYFCTRKSAMRYVAVDL